MLVTTLTCYSHRVSIVVLGAGMLGSLMLTACQEAASWETNCLLLFVHQGEELYTFISKRHLILQFLLSTLKYSSFCVEPSVSLFHFPFV